MKKIFLMLIFGFMSCDRYTTYKLYIDNQTEDTIEIVFSAESPYSMINQEYLTFTSKSKKILYGAEGRIINDPCNYIGINEKEVEVRTSSGRKIRKDIWVISNWNCEGSDDKGWEQTFVITEDDLE